MRVLALPRRLPHLASRRRSISSSSVRRTDGVFRELTDNRIQRAWIDAFRDQQNAKQKGTTKDADESGTPAERDLSPRKMADSYHSVVLPLGQDKWLLDTYANSSGHVRWGAIFMDLDALSGVIAYKHTGDDVTTVTAACDRIIINNPLTEICDLEYSGQVTYATGRSSMEITVQVAKAPKEGLKVDDKDVVLTCQFTMVSLDRKTKKPTQIPAIEPQTDEEKRLFAEGEKNSKHRKQLKDRSLLRQTPNDEESDLIHAMWQRQLQYHDPNDPLRRPDNVQLMEATKLSTAAIMQPQYRNRHDFLIFGGFLLKQTFELAFCCAASFAHARPTFVSLDPSTFKNPVPVGSVLYCTATVVYTDPPLVSSASDDKAGDNGLTRVQVRVDTKVRNVEHGETKPTGQFNYTFTVPKDVKVMPKSYSEFMMYVDARRRLERVKESLLKGDGDEGATERITE
ncbi:Thioesterase/thiol ester dehydrase-isomerase [Myriangium duriaei CBS 260.36]|uniref:Thioesterase/thiol ester dehydrase-isomerase n=1 Tax=Myriangium duriaei CBS 260.36 TaxID=1168546 RepID=A0A9P4JDK8_9PEZI|nr:Thioesterase/thiol ester dehydrase-isomerase [Myriangium duriaei CBS 260.36]